jgi:hypothetical protein
MSKIGIIATVYYAPGPWGVDVPVQGASVEIWDKDLDGNHDCIYTEVTNANGSINGVSSEWVDLVDGIPYYHCDKRGPAGICLKGHWKTPKIHDPTDLRTLIAKITWQGMQIECPYPYVSDSFNIRLVTTWLPPLISKSQRALIVLSNLIVPGDPAFNHLYCFMDFAGISIAQSLLSNDYQSITVLKDNQTTVQNFLNAINTLTNNNNIKVVDVIMNMHGRDGGIIFGNDDTDISAISGQVHLTGKNKLRLLYSTACYGSSHNQHWINAGFKVSVGAKKVNGNAMVEYPTVLTAWKSGSNFNTCISAGESTVTREPMDRAARFINSNWDVNSDKDILGSGNITISTI